MSRGWESKSVEEQQAEQQAQRQAQQQQAEQLSDPDKVAAKDASTDPLLEAERKRKVQTLQLQRERVLSERTSSPHRRTALTNALADIEEKLAELGWTIHL